MNTFDFTPLFRSSVGFDRLARLAEAAVQMHEPSQSYPPYNIEKHGEDAYAITVAVAGFSPDEIEVETQDGLLTIRGHKSEEDRGEDSRILYRGIASRDFHRRFQLADHVRVESAQLENGLLTVSLVREVPEEAKPRRIPVAVGSGPAIEQKSEQPTDKAAA